MEKHAGATLIIILIILVVVTLLGTIAVRSGILGLKIATNSQIRELLLENSNAALFNIEDPAQVTRQLAEDGIFAYFRSAENARDELVFCYRASENVFFSRGKASAILVNNNTVTITKQGVDGFCQAHQFASGRSAILSQVYVSKNTTSSQPFATVPRGSSLGEGQQTSMLNPIHVTVISVLPSFSAATKAQIETCFRKPSLKQGAIQTVAKCFNDLDMPYNMQHADYIVGGEPKLIDR
ncbi:type IV fimbrial biogenesis protein [Acinetobacter puyangensis]|uniref:Pilus assembly protein PilX n=1 Tax=Acinetobacter puyangensis TaxID=1096779 RepID=A0A240E742_9GAMM|nr:pilus assembly protein PilX [Acinetobacter puyangensis]SNX44567.1 hypothetical protein SAMN05421731_103305 [Acinetobacter puyangensis]